jgi:zinc protease
VNIQKFLQSTYIRYLFLTLFFLILSRPGGVSALAVKEYHLSNGLKVLIAEDHKAPVATFQVWYRVGARNEHSGKTGISHLLEHMMFKGTEKHGSKVFSRLIQKNGGIDNAYTTRDFTMYFETLSSDRIALAIELEADRMQNLLLKPEDVKYERSVVMEERRLRYEDDPQNSLYEEVVAAAFKVHPYHHPVIGWMSDLRSIEQEDLLEHYRRYYAPDNAFIVVVGDVNPGEIMEKVRLNFGSIPAGPGAEEVSSEEPPQRGERRIILRREAKLPYIMIGYHTPLFPDRDAAALEVLSTILSGKSGRLYSNLVRGKEVALNAFASYDSVRMDPFLFFLGGTPRPGVDPSVLENALYEEIGRLAKKPPSEKEMEKARNQVEASFIMGQDSIYMMGQMIGSFELIGSWKLMEKYLDLIRSITPEDIQRVARKYFTEENRTVGILIPKQG